MREMVLVADHGVSAPLEKSRVRKLRVQIRDDGVELQLVGAHEHIQKREESLIRGDVFKIADVGRDENLPVFVDCKLIFKLRSEREKSTFEMEFARENFWIHSARCSQKQSVISQELTHKISLGCRLARRHVRPA